MKNLRWLLALASLVPSAGLADPVAEVAPVLEIAVTSDAAPALTSGTLAEVRADDGQVRLSMGIPETYQTHRHRIGPIYATIPGGALAFENLGRPGEMSGYWLDEIDGELIATTRGDGDLTRYRLDADGNWTRAEAQTLDGCGWLYAAYGAVRFWTECIAYGDKIMRTQDLLPDDKSWQGTPVYFASNLALWDIKGKKGGLVACVPGPSQRCARFHYVFPGDLTYAIWRRGDHVIASTNRGTMIEIDPETLEFLVRERHDNESFQVYTATRSRAGTLVGQYPSGQLFLDDGRGLIVPTSEKIPVSILKSSATFEAQSTAVYNGTVLVGVWPFGQLYSGNWKSGFSLTRRAFSGPAIHATENNRQEPYVKSAGNNHLGQRLNDLMLHDGALYMTTSSKSEYRIDTLPFVPPNADEYGQIWRITAPNNVSFPLPDQSGYRLRLLADRLQLLAADGALLAERPMDGASVCGTMNIGDGFLNRLGQGVTVEIMTAPPPCGTAAQP